MIVVDASVITDALTQHDLSDLRQRLSKHALHAPELIDYEVLSALRGLVLGGHLSATRAQDALTDYSDLRLRRHRTTASLRARMWALRDNLTSYDAAYVVLAEQLGCALWTRDRPLAAAAPQQVDINLV